MTRFLTDEQAAYLSRLYTGAEVPELHHAPAAYVRRLEREYAERGMTIQQLCRTIHDRNETIERLEGERDPWMGISALCDRLADLIDPDPDLTCELEPTASERTNAPVRVYECDHCGKSCDSVYAEDYVYCPYCGRLNTAREVEVEE